MSRSAPKIARDALLGMKELPKEGGRWGLLLKKGAEPGELTPAAYGSVQKVDPTHIEFVPQILLSDRGMGVFYGLWFCALALFLFGPGTPGFLIKSFRAGGAELTPAIVWMTISVLAAVLPFIWAYRSARMSLPPPVILSRTLRRFYWWGGRKEGWQSLDYDNAVPVTLTAPVVTVAGSATFFGLSLMELEPGSRRIVKRIGPAPPLGRAEHPEQVWEFIRTYMDGSPEQLPPVDPVPPIEDRRADLARMDRLMLGDFVDARHRLIPGIFPKLYTGFYGAVGYWTERCWLWVQRTAPRPEYPPELREALQWQGENPYRTRPPTEEETLAWEGRLPHLRRRWMIVAVLSTLIYGGMFLLMTIGAWLERGQ